MTMVASEVLPTRLPRVIAQRAGDSLVLLDLDDGRYFSLDGIGPEIWERCDGTRTVEELEHAIAREFAVAPDVVHHDVAALLADLRRERLVAEGT